MDEKNVSVELTKKELFKIQDLIERITGECDFEYQPEAYQKQMKDLELKIFNAITGAN